MVRRLKEADCRCTSHTRTRYATSRAPRATRLKTDVLDARVLSHYGQVFNLALRQPDDGAGQELKDLLKRRKDLVDQRVQERNRLEKGLSGGARRSTERHVAWLDEEIGRMDEEYREALNRNAQLSETAALYRSVPGVGELTAASLVAYLPELGKCDGKALTALVGLAPWSRDSGAQRGYRIRGGRGAVLRVIVPRGLVGGTPQRRVGTLLPWSAESREDWEGGAGSSDCASCCWCSTPSRIEGHHGCNYLPLQKRLD